MNRELEQKERPEIEKIIKTFGVDLTRLPPRMDLAFIARVQRIIRQKPRLNEKTVLLISDSQFKYHEKSILLFLNRKFKKCLCCTRHPDYSTRVELKNVHYIPAPAVGRFSCDYAVVYNWLDFFSRKLPKIKAEKFILLLTAKDGLALRDHPEILRNLEKHRKKTVCFAFFKHTLFSIPVPWKRLGIRRLINWPPTVDLFYEVPQRPIFDYLFLGGGCRDYRLLYQNRDLFKNRKVIITHCDAHEHSGCSADESAYASKHTALLKKHGNFVCLNRINESLYCRLLLQSRVVICLFRSRIQFDTAGISDALWYGKPVITSETVATGHLKGLVLFVKNREDLKTALDRLDDPAFFKKISQKAKRYARRENDIFDLLKRIP